MLSQLIYFASVTVERFSEQHTVTKVRMYISDVQFFPHLHYLACVRIHINRFQMIIFSRKIYSFVGRSVSKQTRLQVGCFQQKNIFG